MNLLSRQNSFRCFVVIVLVALLLGALLLHAGNLPALLTEIFVFLFLLAALNFPLKDASTAVLADGLAEQRPARAPPTPSI